MEKDKYINRGLKATKTGFGEGVLAAAMENGNVVGIGLDITGSVGMNLFAERFPERFFSIGIAEQNGMGISAGLALAGKVPVIATYGVFSALRTTDFIRVSVCYNNLHVVIGGAHAGISVGPDGATHQALEDIAVMRVMPGMTVISPCDATQVKILTQKAIHELNGPVYIRFGREPVPDFTSPEEPLTIGRVQVLRTGRDVTLFATGHMVWEALEAARLLAEKSVDAEVINIHTVKPMDRDGVLASVRKTGACVTAEEHQVTGGLGGAVAELLCSGHPVPLEMIGMPDCFGESGTPDELLEKYGMKAVNIAEAALKVTGRKNSR
ncbi:MAG: transketolase C-terminal domain-containing protein [Bacteroidales bacterium]|jgi:transketolase